MVTHPNCKINIGLHVTSKRPDGYHNLETIFYPISLCDELDISISNEFFFSQDGIPISGDPKDNLCVKAYTMLYNDFPHNIPPVNIHLVKNIPFGAGLGGGSSDAAFTIKMINDICHLQLSIDAMESYARRLGADCAFFIRNKAVYAYERGDVFESINLDLSSYQIVLLKPSCSVSTKEAYQNLIPKKGEYDLRQLVLSPIVKWQEMVVNHFEQSVFVVHPEIADLKQLLYNKGALYASMSGSGSAVYGLFEKSIQVHLDNLPQGTLAYILSNK